MYRRLILTVLILAACRSVSYAANVQDLMTRSRPLVIAHRGASGDAPENTLPAFRRAMGDGADLVELDYLHSADGVPLVIHDETLDRTTDATARWGETKIAVGSKSAAAIRSLDAGRWFSPTFAGTPVPTLVDSIDTIQQGSTALIERKGGDAATLVALLRERGWLSHVVVQSFDWKFLSEAHRLAPELVFGALGPPQRFQGRELTDQEKVLSREFIDSIHGLGAAAVVWNDGVTADSIRYAHGKRLRVWVYTVNDPEKARQLVDLGTDGIITDHPAAIRRRLDPPAPSPPAARKSDRSAP
jgi:glycerophosphoryl diester phosphodiesterase